MDIGSPLAADDRSASAPMIDHVAADHNDLKAAYRATFGVPAAPRNATKAQLAEAIQTREPIGDPVPGAALLAALAGQAAGPGPEAPPQPPVTGDEPIAAPVVREQKTVVVAPNNRKALAAALMAQTAGGR